MNQWPWVVWFNDFNIDRDRPARGVITTGFKIDSFELKMFVSDVLSFENV